MCSGSCSFSAFGFASDWQNYNVQSVVINWDKLTASSILIFDNIENKVFYLIIYHHK